MSMIRPSLLDVDIGGNMIEVGVGAMLFYIVAWLIFRDARNRRP